MDEYIKREYAVDAVADVYYNTPDINLSCEKFEAAILKIQAADVAPVVHGRWELEYGTYGKMRCSVCKKEALIEKTIGDVGVITNYVDSNYCPYCGAKMDEKENDNGC